MYTHMFTFSSCTRVSVPVNDGCEVRGVPVDNSAHDTVQRGGSMSVFFPGHPCLGWLIFGENKFEKDPSSGGTKGRHGNQLHVKFGLFEYGLGQQQCGRDAV